MFWRWHIGWKFMETEPGQHISQHNRISQELFFRTFWGDYGGTILSRYHYNLILENAGNSVDSVNAMHGQGLILKDETVPSEVRFILEVLHFLRTDDYPIWDDSDFSDWETELTDSELTEGWTGQELHREVEREWDRLIDGWEFPLDFGSKEWNLTVFAFVYGEENNEYPYWEAADSLVIPNIDTREVVMYILREYVAPSPYQDTQLF